MNNDKTEELELMLEQQANGRGDNPDIDPPDVAGVADGDR